MDLLLNKASLYIEMGRGERAKGILEETLTIQGTRKNESEEKKDNYHRIERSYGSFKRSFRIPGGFQHDKVKATFADGVLSLTLPKVEEQKARQIEVSGN